ncbi:MAG: hypothetical protein V2A56_08045 [bacterium]
MPKNRTYTIAHFADELSRWQAARTLEALQNAGYGVWPAREIETEEDFDPSISDERKRRSVRLLAALLGRDVDAVVSSTCDLPIALSEGIRIVAALPRGVVNDALVCHVHLGFRDLPKDAKVGLSSARQAGQLLRLRGDVEVLMVHGSIPSRLAMIDAGDLDAVLLPWVDLRRLGLAWRVDDVFGVTELLPTPARAISAILVRQDDHEVTEIMSAISHHSTLLRLRVERAFTHALGLESHVGIAALSSDYGREGMRLIGRVVAPDGSAMVEVERNILYGEEPHLLGEKVAKELLDRGAADLVK